MLGTKEAADRLGLSQAHVRRLLESGTIEGKRLGRDWIVLNLSYKRRRKPKVGRKIVKQNG
ncbi:MAG: helix-turn-helix domain-containing protein [Dehalococcoidia bacterium]|nr:helix-turn-helix domain-containing protein [Dehalococcoidia bacterium]